MPQASSATGRSPRRRVCFVTGTRAEYRLMRTVLEAIRAHPSLQLQLIATGMHLDPRHGRTVRSIEEDGFIVDAVVGWPPAGDANLVATAASTGRAMAELAEAYARLESEIVLVVGDRVEAFAAAAAAHVSHRLVAHVHGGDRAAGQVDDALRHAITKLAHLHFPATPASARRIARLGEESWRVHRVGSPGIDGIAKAAVPWETLAPEFPSLAPNRYALLLLHPVDPDDQLEHRRASMLLKAVRSTGIEQALAIYPNNDPGAAGIIRCWREAAEAERLTVCRDLPRGTFLALMRDAAVLAGNSSCGIIEAASFKTPVLDIGPRQRGRERSPNVAWCDYSASEMAAALRRIWNRGRPCRPACRNVYGGEGAGRRIARILGTLQPGRDLLCKLIRY